MFCQFQIEDKEPAIAMLIDPDKFDEVEFDRMLGAGLLENISCFLIGGSILHNNRFDFTVSYVTKNVPQEVYIFPGDSSQISSKASGILLLSLISGRNPDYLIGHHVKAARQIKDAEIDIIPTAYILVDGGKRTAVEYISNTLPIPQESADIISNTALAGEQLGLKIIYLEAGSGAAKPVNPKIIELVRKTVDLPIIVGGGLRTISQVEEAFGNGADMVVIGNGFEKNSRFLEDINKYLKTVRVEIDN